MYGVYSDSSIASLISIIQSRLNINFGNIDPFTRNITMTKECLTEAAKMFTYLNICGDEAWLKFYKDLFQNKDELLMRKFIGGAVFYLKCQCFDFIVFNIKLTQVKNLFVMF